MMWKATYFKGDDSMKKGLVIAILLDILTLIALHAIGYDVKTFEAILIGLICGLIGGMLTNES